MQIEQTVEQMQLELSKALAANATLQQEISDVLAVNDSLTHEIEQLTKKLSMCNCIKRSTGPNSMTATELASYTFTLTGQKYGFNFFRLQLNQQPISAIEVVASPELQQQLVSSGSGM